MAHNNNQPPPPLSSFSPYPAWPQMAHAATAAAAAAAPAQQSAIPYTPVQSTSAPHAAQPTPTQNMSLPPELQNLNLTPQQLAAMFTFFQAQSNAVPFPPAPPPLTPTPASQPTFQTSSLDPTPTGAYARQERANTSAHQNERSNVPLPLANAHSTQPAMSTDREDGELSDSGPKASQSRPPSRLRKRKHNTSPDQNRLVSQRSSHYDDLQTNGHGHPRPGTASIEAKTTTQHEANQSHANTIDPSQSKSMIMTFVAAMHKEGFSYDELAAEGLDPTLLRATYAELQIPVLPKDPLPQASLAIATAPPLAISENSSQREHAVPSAPPQTAKSPATNVLNGAPAAPVDRKSYLARLQAAKVKKGSAPVPNSTASAPKPVPKPLPAISPVAAPVAQTSPSTASTLTPVTQVAAPTKPQSTQTTSDAATELVRKKMEALKSLKRRMAPQPPATSSTPPSSNLTAMPHAGAVPITQQEEAHAVPVGIQQVSAPDVPVASSPAQNPAPFAPPPGLSTGGIPGLFMAAVSSKSSPSNTPSQRPAVPPKTLPAGTTSEKTPNASPRPTPPAKRRTVAADLNEANVQPDVSIKYKRPFGQSRQNSSDDAMIIEVSDDEDGFGDNVQSAAEITVPARQKSIRDLPPLRDFPQRSAMKKAGLLPGTPTPLGTPGTSSDAEELKRKEQEINALQLRIQEFERRKTALRAKGQIMENRTESPSASERIAAPQEAPISRVTLPGLSVGQIPGLETKVEPSPDQHLKLKADISASDAALNNRRSQMMELQRQMAELQKQCEEEELNKQRLRVQLESLDIETDGMTHSEMQAKKDEIDKQMEEARTKADTDGMVIDSDSPPATANDDTAIISGSKNLGDVTMQKSPSEKSFIRGRYDLLPVPHETKTPMEIVTGPQVDSQATTVDESNRSGADDLYVSAAAEDPIDDGNDNEDSDDSDDEGSSMSESTDSEEGEAPIQASVTAVSPGASSSDAEMDTSESSSDESRDNTNEQTAMAEATHTTSPDVSSSLESQAPAEEESGMAETPADDEELEGTDMDLDSSGSDDESEYEPLASTATALSAATPVPLSHSTDTDIINEEVADQVAPEFQGSTEPQQGLDALQATSIPSWPQGSSYESSLKNFKKYRFHPDYLQNVSGGFHSLTYSHQILPHVPLCRFEFYGGDCRDQSCEGQHWRDLALSDDQLLIQLGTNQANPGKNKADVASYNVGLKKIIQELRQEGTSDSEVVCARIAQYRRQFIGDPTVVVTQ